MLSARSELIFRARRVHRSGGARAVIRSLLQVLNARWRCRRADTAPTVRLRGRAYIRGNGRIAIGERVRMDGFVQPIHLSCFRDATLTIGEGTFINYGCNIGATERIEIGRNCDIGQLTIIMDSDWHETGDHRSSSPSGPVIIEDDVWIGARVTILKGTHIGRGAVVGAHAVVRGDVPPRSVVGGVPARLIKYLEAPAAGREAGA